MTSGALLSESPMPEEVMALINVTNALSPVDGSAPWKPDSITQFFTRLRERVGLEHLAFHDLRKFMETHAQDLGFAPAAVAMRAGHDPSVMSKHCTGRIEESDRALASAVAALITEQPG